MIKDKIRNMKDMDRMDQDEKDTVIVGCLTGFAIGLFIALLVFGCIGMVILIGVTQ